tara:strand:+ start:23767 stop:24873 length:1107 start_codon:yes stop_codon:yes gene_type:complete
METKTIFVVSTNRSDYGLLQAIIKKINKYKKYKLIVIRLVGKNNKNLDSTICVDWEEKIISYSLSSNDFKETIYGSLEICKSFSKLIIKKSPNLILVLGDRYELLPIVSQALISKIPIAHFSGGEITLGAIDDKIRNMVSFASDLHLVAHNEAKQRLSQVLGKNNTDNIYVVGEPGLEEIKNTKFKSIDYLSKLYNLDLTKKFIICTLHPETSSNLFADQADIFFKTLSEFDSQIPILISYGNNDPAGFDINLLMRKSLSKRKNTFMCESFGQINFWSLLSYAHIIIGNSSSGLVEAPFLGCWTIDVGNRQTGRIFGNTVMRINIDENEINHTLLLLLKKERSISRFSPYGDGESSNSILKIINSFLQ